MQKAVKQSGDDQYVSAELRGDDAVLETVKQNGGDQYALDERGGD